MYHRTLLHIVRLLCLCATALLAAGCAPETEAQPEPGKGVWRTVFRITVSDTSGESPRHAPARTGQGYAPGQGYENYIDLEGGSFRFYFFDENNRFIAPLEVESVLPAGETDHSRTYAVSGDTRARIDGARVKLVALANWPVYPETDALVPGTTTIADLCAGEYAFEAADMLPSKDHLIPLFGISALQTLRFDAFGHASLGTLHMLRAFAKIEVIRSEECDIDIEWARIYRYNSRGFCAPQGVNSQDDCVHGSYDEDYVRTPHIPQGCEVASEIAMAKTEAGTFVAYVPEYRNLAPDGSPRPEAERSVLRVHFREDTGSAYDVVEFKDYAGTTGHFDILRNYWYRFTLSKSLSPMVQMVPYNEVDLAPGFGLLVDPNYVPVTDIDGVLIYWYDPDTGKYYGLDKVTEVPDPYISTDPVTGWSLVRDENNRFFCYYDQTADRYYATDKSTRIKSPFEHVTVITVDGRSVECNCIIDAQSSKLYYYYDRSNSVWYHPDRTPLGADEQPVYKS